MTAPAVTLATVQPLASKLGPLLSFPWHRQQRVALAQATDTIVILGGTQGGKSSAGMGILARVMRREGPIYRRLQAAHRKHPTVIIDPDTRPLKLWVAPKTGEKALSVWEPLLREQAFGGLPYDYVQSPHRVFTWADGVSRENTLWLKSQDQGLLAFESDAVDLVLFDEEPLDRRLVGAARGRTTTTNGVIVLAFTPLHGLTWTHGAYYVPICRPEYQLADRVWRDGSRLALIQMGMADNPAAVAGGGVQRLRDDPTITEAERNTRLYGSYGYAEGLIFPVLAGLFTDQPDSLYLLDGLPKGRAYSWVLTCDPNKRHGGLLTALDEEGNRYAVAEHYAENLPDREHVARYRALLAALGLEEGTVPTYADPGGAGAQAILNLADLDFYAEAVPKGPGSVKASIEMVRRALWPNPTHRHPVTGRMGAPALYFLRSLRSQWTTDGVDYDESRLLWELRQYRQQEDKPPDTPVKKWDDCTDTLLYSYLVRPYVPGEAAAKWGLPAPPTRKLDRMSQLAVTDYERTVTKIAKQNRRGR